MVFGCLLKLTAPMLRAVEEANVTIFVFFERAVFTAGKTVIFPMIVLMP